MSIMLILIKIQIIKLKINRLTLSRKVQNQSKGMYKLDVSIADVLTIYIVLY